MSNFLKFSQDLFTLKKRSISITGNYMKSLPVKYSTKQTCLVYMMPNSKLRHAINRCYASLPLPKQSILSPIEAPLNTWLQPLPDPSNNKTSEESRVPDYKRVGRVGVVRRFVILKSLSRDILDARNVSRSHYNSFLLSINSSINN